MSSITTEDLGEQLAQQRQKVDVDHFDITVRELVRMVTEGELHTAPVYQRKFRWNEEKESRLIESILLNFPIPSIFVATNKDGTWEVVDGLQRISTLVHFAGGSELWDSIGKSAPLRLSGLRDLKAFDSRTFDDLPTAIQLALYKRALRVTALSDKSSRDTRFDLFERLNSGGVALSPQEIRAAIFQGDFNDMLRELADSDAFSSIIRLQKGKQDDGTKEEMVLKFFAYYHNQKEFRGEVTQFLNDFMESSTGNLDIEDEKARFLTMTVALQEVLDGKSFVRKNYGPTPLVELEAVMVAAAHVLAEFGELGQPKKGWIEDKALVAASTKGTNTKAMLASRIDRAKALLTPQT